MRTSQPTDSLLGPALALADLAREHPGLPVTADIRHGRLSLHTPSSAAFGALREALGLAFTEPVEITYDGEPMVAYWAFGSWRDVDVSLNCQVPAEQVFQETHNPDPQEWTAQERQEFAA